MREDGGFEVIKKAILNLSLRHKEHISAYGEGNERRLTGKHETASINTFSWVCFMRYLCLVIEAIDTLYAFFNVYNIFRDRTCREWLIAVAQSESAVTLRRMEKVLSSIKILLSNL